jgi:[ribosomal protein S18]-alanine N-acetyltransferase
MQPEDIPAVFELEIETPSAWSRKQFMAELEQPTGIQFVVRRAGSEKILAFMCGRQIADEAEILKLGVAEGVRRKGIGSQLLDHTLKFFKAKGAKNCFLELRASNSAAGKLYEKKGFTAAGKRKAYYDNPAEDAVLMQRGL